MSKPSYDDLVDLLAKVYKETRVESVLGIEWANYPVEVFDEVSEVVIGFMNLELKNE